jgi:hypothetical protein
MSVKEFFSGDGEVHFENVFLSPRIVKETLEKRFILVPIVESSSHLR